MIMIYPNYVSMYGIFQRKENIFWLNGMTDIDIVSASLFYLILSIPRDMCIFNIAIVKHYDLDVQ